MTSGDVQDDKNRSVVTEHQHHQPPPPFQGVSNYPPPPQHQPPAAGYPQPAQPYPYAPGYAVAGGMPATEHHHLPCCGIGVGWVLFILGFFFGFPWYIGLVLLFFSRNPRERPGYIGCAIGSVILTIAIVVGAIRGASV